MKQISTFLIVALAAFVAQSALAESKLAEGKAEKKEKTSATGKSAALCVVAGAPIDKSVYSTHKNRRVYFCCNGCKSKFDAQPAKFNDGMQKQWEAIPVIRTQVLCPIKRRPVKLAYYVDAPDMRLYFSSAEAREGFMTSGETVQQARPSKLFTFQNTCVISGNPINPEIFRDLNGYRVYFFCPHCAAKGETEPEATVKKAKEQAKKNSSAFTSAQLELLKGLMEKKQEKKQ